MASMAPRRSPPLAPPAPRSHLGDQTMTFSRTTAVLALALAASAARAQSPAGFQLQ